MGGSNVFTFNQLLEVLGLGGGLAARRSSVTCGLGVSMEKCCQQLSY